MEKIRTGVCFGTVSFFLAYGGAKTLSFLGYASASDFDKSGFLQSYFVWAVLLALILAPLWEEFYYRFLPIYLFQKLGADKTTLWLIIVVSSIVFGLSHGSWHNIFVQGLAGLVFSMAYLRGGFWMAVFAHSFHNFLSLGQLLILNYAKQFGA